jgi:hypothetical protein
MARVSGGAENIGSCSGEPSLICCALVGTNEEGTMQGSGRGDGWEGTEALRQREGAWRRPRLWRPRHVNETR